MELTKETSLFKKDAIKTDVTAAAATATNYIEDVSGSNQTGMTLQPASNSADNYMQLDATEIGIYQNGHKIASYGNIITLYRLVSDNPVKTLEITGTGLQLYGSSTINADVSLTSAGLVLGKGGIEAGTPSSNNFIYLSTEGYPLKNSNVTPTITGLTINNFTPTAAQTDGRTIDDMPWRQVIGTKFGVTSDGTLYANGAHITGQITIDGHSDSLSTEMSNLQTATDDAATKATNYLTNLENVDGLVVRKDATSNSDFVNILSNAIRIVTGGAEAFKVWVENNITKLRLGLSNAYHILVGSDGIKFMLDSSNLGADIKCDILSFQLGRHGAAMLKPEIYESILDITDTGMTMRNQGPDNTMVQAGNNAYNSADPGFSVYVRNDKAVDEWGRTRSSGFNVRSIQGTNNSKIQLYSDIISVEGCAQFFGNNHKSDQTPDVRIALGQSTTSGYYVKEDYSDNNRLKFQPSSSKRYKHDIQPINDNTLDPHKLYDVEVVQFIYNDDHIDNGDQRFRKKVPGFIAEDLYKYYPIAVDLRDGRPEDWNYRFILPSMLKLIQEQHEEIETLKTKINILEEKNI